MRSVFKHLNERMRPVPPSSGFKSLKILFLLHYSSVIPHQSNVTHVGREDLWQLKGGVIVNAVFTGGHKLLSPEPTDRACDRG